MLSGLGKLVDKSFIVAFVLPTLLGIIAYTSLVPDVPWFGNFAKALNPATASKLDDLAIFALSVWALAIVLSMTNYVQYRILEGYPFRTLPFARSLHVAIFRRRARRYGALYQEWADAAAPGSDVSFTKGEELADAQARLLQYPAETAHVLPTAFGNAIGSFESYAARVYGIGTIAAWSRLSFVLPRDVQTSLNEARSQVDFLVNVCYISGTLAIVLLVRAVAPHAPPAPAATRFDLIAFAVASATSYVAYWWAVAQVRPWGELVKSAFDCYLPALAAQMGFTVGSGPEDRRSFWAAVTQVFLFEDTLDLERWLAARADPQEQGWMPRMLARIAALFGTSDAGTPPSDPAAETSEAEPPTSSRAAVRDEKSKPSS